jgi:hypothetical protein
MLLSKGSIFGCCYPPGPLQPELCLSATVPRNPQASVTLFFATPNILWGIVVCLRACHHFLFPKRQVFFSCSYDSHRRTGQTPRMRIPTRRNFSWPRRSYPSLSPSAVAAASIRPISPLRSSFCGDASYLLHEPVSVLVRRPVFTVPLQVCSKVSPAAADNSRSHNRKEVYVTGNSIPLL